MIVYLDTSVILRRLFGQTPALETWGKWSEAIVSELVRVESLRGVDRQRLLGCLTEDQVADSVSNLTEILSRTVFVKVSQSILEVASRSYPTVIGTLDAIHLATAQNWQESQNEEILFITHDLQLGRAARAIGLKSAGF